MPPPEQSVPPTPSMPPPARGPISTFIILGAVVVIVAAAGAYWYLLVRSTPPQTDGTATAPCQEVVTRAFAVGAVFSDTHTDLSFSVPTGTVAIEGGQSCPVEDWKSTVVSFGEEKIHITAAKDENHFAEWAAGVPVTKLDSFIVEIDGTIATATVYDVDQLVSGEWKPYNEPFLVIFVSYQSTYYKIQLPYKTEELKKESLAFLRSVKFQDSSTPESTVSDGDGIIEGRLVYSHSNYVDPQKKRFGVSFEYTAEPPCDSMTTTDVFTIESGDGRTYPADCKGVVEHTYATPGAYTARYLKNGEAIASVRIAIE